MKSRTASTQAGDSKEIGQHCPPYQGVFDFSRKGAIKRKKPETSKADALNEAAALELYVNDEPRAESSSKMVPITIEPWAVRRSEYYMALERQPLEFQARMLFIITLTPAIGGLAALIALIVKLLS